MITLMKPGSSSDIKINKKVHHIEGTDAPFETIPGYPDSYMEDIKECLSHFQSSEHLESALQYYWFSREGRWYDCVGLFNKLVEVLEPVSVPYKHHFNGMVFSAQAIKRNPVLGHLAGKLTTYFKDKVPKVVFKMPPATMLTSELKVSDAELINFALKKVRPYNTGLGRVPDDVNILQCYAWEVHGVKVSGVITGAQITEGVNALHVAKYHKYLERRELRPSRDEASRYFGTNNCNYDKEMLAALRSPK